MNNLLAQAQGAVTGQGGIIVLIFGLLVIGISLWALIFWLRMLIHAASKSVPNKPLWIIILIFTGIIGAIAYYFTVKKQFNAPLVA